MPTVNIADTIEAPKELTSVLDREETQETVKSLLKDGTPKWFSHPEDYKNFAIETVQEEQERGEAVARQYRIEGQAELTDETSRLVNFLPANKFLSILRANGLTVKVYDGGKPQTMGLYVLLGGDYKMITSIQVPTMPEWSLLAEDEHGAPNGESAIGWRTAVAHLITHGALTEEKAHKIFGEPVIRAFTSRYRQTLYDYRNRKGEYSNV
jgi:hypothetical protein